ncbi:MAG: type III pantothenate kinase [Gemmatimonadota bacterium]
MILAVDVGNTETVLGLFRDVEPLHTWRLSTEVRRTPDEHALLVRGLVDRAVSPSDGPLKRAVVVCVVPMMDRVWERTCGALGVPHLVVTPDSPLPIELDVEDPAGVGADRIVNTLAARHLYGRDTVVVDLGTATTFDCITAKGEFLGGVIAPGPRAGLERLTHATSRLPEVEIGVPDRVVGRRTEACLNSGIFYSIVDGIDGIVRRILAEWRPEDPLVVATGGLVDVIAPHCETVDRVEPHLTLRGIALAERHLTEGVGSR